MSVEQRSRILITAILYLPAFKNCGPIRSLHAITEALGDEFAFHILASDRDLGDTSTFAGVFYNEWRLISKVLVRYLAPALGQGWPTYYHRVMVARERRNKVSSFLRSVAGITTRAAL